MYQKARIHGRDPAYDLAAEDDEVKKRKLHFGKCRREFLLDKYCMEGMSGADVASISFFASEAGCLGVEDLSLRPELASKHGNEHVKHHAGKIWPDLDLQMIQCPMYDKREARRNHCANSNVSPIHGIQQVHHRGNDPNGYPGEPIPL